MINFGHPLADVKPRQCLGIDAGSVKDAKSCALFGFNICDGRWELPSTRSTSLDTRISENLILYHLQAGPVLAVNESALQ